jgi:hypothetical protein
MPNRPVVSFRASPDLHCKLEQLRATFPKQQWAPVFEWLFEDEDLMAKISERVANGG